MNLLTHFRQHVDWFGNILMFSTDVNELAQKDQIKDCYRASNKIHTVLQILNIYTRPQAFEIQLLNLEALYCSSASYDEHSTNLHHINQDLWPWYGINNVHWPEIQLVLVDNLLQWKLINHDSTATSLLHITERFGLNDSNPVQCVSKYGSRLDDS